MRRAMTLTLALTLIIVAVSEVLFYPIALSGLGMFLVFYAPAVLFAFVLFERSGARDWGAMALAAAVLGWLIEGVIVFQSYEAVPWSLVWTALAWHGVISIGVGVIGVRHALLSRRVWIAPVVCAALGAAFGIWGAYGWTFLAPDLATSHGFGVQVVAAAVMLGLGHAVLDVVPEGPVVPGWVMWGLAGLAALVWALAWAVPYAPISALVPILIGVSVWALWRRRTPAEAVAFGRIGARVGWIALIPAVAIPVQRAVFGAGWVVELNWIIAGPTALLGVGLWGAAVVRGVLRR